MITAMAMAMLLAQAGGGGGGSRPAATPVGSPAMWFGPDDYPLQALWGGEEGRVAFLVDVDVSGAPTGCHIVTSSGSSALDNGTCAIILKKGQFKPAHGDSGKPVAGQWSSATHWQLDGTPPPIDLTAGPYVVPSLSIVVNVDSEGKAIECRTESTIPGKIVGPDPCSDYKPGRSIVGPLRKDGKPVPGIVTFSSSETVTSVP